MFSVPMRCHSDSIYIISISAEYSKLRNGIILASTADFFLLSFLKFLLNFLKYTSVPRAKAHEIW